MNVSQSVVEQLEQLAATGPKEVEAVMVGSAGQREYIVGVPSEGQGPSIALTLADYDRFSIALLNLEVTYQHLSLADYDLRQHADQVANRLIYLEEPLALVELNTEQKVAQLRSHHPYQKDETVIYWEVMLWAEPYPRATLTRYSWTPGQSERERVAYPATFTTVGRMATDLAVALLSQE